MMKVLLGMWNYEVALANAVADGLHLAQSEYFDMYLLDIHMPDEVGLLDELGFELCEQICGTHGHAPVVFISAATDEACKQRGRQAGAIAYLTKPLDFDLLETTLTRLISEPLRNGLGKHFAMSYLSNYESASLSLSGKLEDMTVELNYKYDSGNT